ncbi:hypothetical protein [Mesorhizobium shangrilense]|uniref:Uncharacterized protein n=1 Tax=Mesorhizobium shangrilense TaxID=460060 RepID=A0ABV2D723_9HYPH
MHAQLPRFDKNARLIGDDSLLWRHALMVEDDPKVLDDYARGLWQQWQALVGKGGVPVKGYSKETVKAAVIWLTGQYVDVEAPIPYELSRLVDAIAFLKRGASTPPFRPTSESAYRAAVKFEAKYPANAPATRYKVAQHLCNTGLLLSKDNNTPQKTAEATVRDWRKSRHYQESVELYRRMEWKAGT